MLRKVTTIKYQIDTQINIKMNNQNKTKQI